MSPAPVSTGSSTDAPLALHRVVNDELVLCWSGTGDVVEARYDSHVPHPSGGLEPIVELRATVRLHSRPRNWAESPLVWLDPHENAVELRDTLRDTAWNRIAYVQHGGGLVRVKEWRQDFEAVTLIATTGHVTLATYPDGHFVDDFSSPIPAVDGLVLATPRAYRLATVALSEPPMPVPADQWLPQQRRLASDRLLADAGHLCRPSTERSTTPEPATSP
ncbi:hypothetical protein [Williamsia deligens]|uniref:Uncharacterized protein n=1 Tax=Williamsia deligens TaxID=321325 RepID=A0ABW3G8X5_9NOCA|nr:hypothetical protein [Williamsia deligens]MCP2195683.1 hypothetical protein [Williamsia deligens]